MAKMIKKSGQRGIALIVVLCMTSIMVAAAVQMISQTRREITETTNLRDGLQALYLARSGVAFSEASLNAEKTAYDGLDQPWADSKTWSARFNALIEEGQSYIVIEDETGKIPINFLINKDGAENAEIRNLLVRFLNLPEWNLTEEQSGIIVDSIKDWMISNSQPSEGSDSSDTESEPQRKGPFRFPEEILKTGAVSRDLLYGTAGKPGLCAYVTLYGKGKININTAPGPVLMALFPGISKDTLEQIDFSRRRGEAKLDDPAWYRQVIGTSGLNPASELIMTRSEAFRITSTGVLGSCRRTVTGILEKDGKSEKFKLRFLYGNS